MTSKVLLVSIAFVALVLTVEACFGAGGGGGCCGGGGGGGGCGGGCGGGGCGGGGGGCGGGGGGCGGGCGKRKKRALEDDDSDINVKEACSSKKLKNLITQSIVNGNTEKSVATITEQLEQTMEGSFVTWCAPMEDPMKFVTTMDIYCSATVANITCNVFNH
uniref:Ground-like domain-containing protein n=1 Tax=Steinernema glaseri TaxID=37863 RepID=A0A1I8AJ97_9BILA